MGDYLSVKRPEHRKAGSAPAQGLRRLGRHGLPLSSVGNFAAQRLMESHPEVFFGTTVYKDSAEPVRSGRVEAVSYAPVIQMAGHHPLEDDPAEFKMAAFEQYKRENPGGELSLEAFLMTQGEFIDRFYEERRHGEHGDADDTGRASFDSMLAKSIAALSVIHREGTAWTGLSTGLEEDMMMLVNEPYGHKTEMAAAYGLTEEELRALEAYTDANKEVERFEDGSANPRFMGQNSHWGNYRSGWRALEGALRKIPSLRALGIQATTYRIPRSKDEVDRLKMLPNGQQIVHGAYPMKGGQYHYMSTAMTYNVHLTKMNVQKRGGFVAVTGGSGYYINPFGVQSWSTDGGEILYPPGTKTRKVGDFDLPKDEDGGFSVVHLDEDEAPLSSYAVSDSEDYPPYHPGEPRPLSLRERSEIYQELDPEYIFLARHRTGIHGPIAYITDNELIRLQMETRRIKQMRGH